MIVQGQVEGSGPWCEWQSEAMRQQSRPEICPQGSNRNSNNNDDHDDRNDNMIMIMINF